MPVAAALSITWSSVIFPVFIAAIKHISFDDAIGILKGNDDAATTYLKNKTINEPTGYAVSDQFFIRDKKADYLFAKFVELKNYLKKIGKKLNVKCSSDNDVQFGITPMIKHEGRILIDGRKRMSWYKIVN